jgi:hypothetical protein
VHPQAFRQLSQWRSVGLADSHRMQHLIKADDVSVGRLYHGGQPVKVDLLVSSGPAVNIIGHQVNRRFASPHQQVLISSHN